MSLRPSTAQRYKWFLVRTRNMESLRFRGVNRSSVSFYTLEDTTNGKRSLEAFVRKTGCPQEGVEVSAKHVFESCNKEWEVKDTWSIFPVDNKGQVESIKEYLTLQYGVVAQDLNRSGFDEFLSVRHFFKFVNWNPKKGKFEPKKLSYAIFDLDGVLFCAKERWERYKEGGTREEYMKGAVSDRVLGAGSTALNAFYNFTFDQSGLEILFLTMRYEDSEDGTALALAKVLGVPISHIFGSLYMRRETDTDHMGVNLKDAAVKNLRLFELGIDPTADVKLVFEDNQRVVDNWRDQGVTCYQTEVSDH